MKTIFRNIDNLKSSTDCKFIIITHDLTPIQKIIVKDLKTICDELNVENKDPNCLWTISHSNSNLKLTKNIKTQQTSLQHQKLQISNLLSKRT